MVKFIALLKRRDGMSFEEFKDYYENNHSKLMSRIPHSHVSMATGYRRSYLIPTPHPIEQATAGVDYDCITELEYPDREAMEKDMLFFRDEDIRNIFIEDEEKLFDRAHIRCYVIEED